MSSNYKQILIEKLDYLRTQHAICAGGAQRFQLQKEIEGVEKELMGIGNEGNPTPSGSNSTNQQHSGNGDNVGGNKIVNNYYGKS